MKFRILSALFFLLSFLFTGCQTESFEEPVISFENYQVADGFEIQLAASEPLIAAPVTMDFDNEGRMWVVEMRGFMPNLAGSGEDEPNGRITILEDRDEDGVADHSKVFLDGLVLPRAVAHAYGGLLYAAPPNLWFVEINDDKPGKKTLVDSLYSDGGNVEQQPNGLMMNIDNWIYSANSNFRYQFKDGKWKKEITSFRGQWGIAKDNWGRLYYNNNTTQLIGDYVMPNTFINNPYLRPSEAINKVLIKNQRVFPLHPTTVNRGYDKGILDEDSLLINFTAACGPLIYRGDQFPKDYSQNAFVCEPMANLIKRNVVNFEDIKTTGEQAWTNHEFIASTDEAFRPVNLFNGPDGAMYVVDMHRGVLQHRADITPYYEEHSAAKKLDTILSKGRILRIKNTDERLRKIPEFKESSNSELVMLLKSDNGWVRDRAQHILIYKQLKSAIPSLEEFVLDADDEVTALHALNTLNGLNALSFETLAKAASSGSSMLTAHALLLLENFATPDNIDQMAGLATNLTAKNDSVTHLYLALSLGSWTELSPKIFFPLLEKISQIYADKAIYQEAVISSSKGMEENLQNIFNQTSTTSSSELLNNLLVKTIKNKQTGNKNSIFVQVSVAEYGRQKGLTLFRSTCATCHGHGGEGIANLAPPLKDSEYVSGSVERLALIILKGMEGPVHVNGHLYELNASMPGFENNLTDREISDIISYLRNVFVLRSQFAPAEINSKKIEILRTKNQGILTGKKLLEMYN